MSNSNKIADILIIGAGPVGLFTVFEAGLLKMKCHLLDSLPVPGGQLSEIYPKKPIYDIPGYPSVIAQDLVDNLMKQIEPFSPTFTLGERAEVLTKTDDHFYKVITNKGTELIAPVVAIAGGLGSFEPRKPPLDNIAKFEDNGVDYFVKDPEKYRDKKLLIAGGGDSALDWTIVLSDIASEITMVHRRSSFRGAIDSVDKVMELVKQDKVRLITEAQVTALVGKDKLEFVTVDIDKVGIENVEVDYFLPLFGLSPKLGPIEFWGMDIEDHSIKVNTFDYSTNLPGVYAIGDVNTYPGKLKLILCGFHEGTLMVQSAFKYIYPDQKLSFKYTTVTGINPLSNT
jgi:thioredoxin reductase (NADPH)